MKCQYCNCLDSKVIDSRPTEEGTSIRRRRECINCGRRFTTYEKIELVPLMVVKRDGRREAFDAQKIKAGIVHACEKLPVSMNQIDAMTARIEQSAYASMEGEVTSQRIGDMVMQELKAGKIELGQPCNGCAGGYGQPLPACGSKYAMVSMP